MNKQSSSFALSVGRFLFWGFVLLALYAINQASGNNLFGAVLSAISQAVKIISGLVAVL